MKETRFTLLVFAAALGFALFGCTMTPGGETKETEEPKQLSVMVWNTQTLFDGTCAGTEYEDYREEKDWNNEKYAARILSISEAIEKAFEDGAPPALIGLVELESIAVLEDLAKGPLAKYGYNRVFFGGMDGSPLGAGALSRFPLSGTRLHSIRAVEGTAPRPVLELNLEIEGEKLVFFICHWKSKLGGDDATEPLRRASAKVINRRIAEIRKENSQVPVIIMGDLNENHDEFFRRSGETVCALMPDDSDAAELAAAKKNPDFIIISGEKPPRADFFDAPGSGIFYTPWGNELKNGSYYYRENWETIDHFLLDAGFFDNQGWEFEDCRVIAKPPFIGEKGRPKKYTPWNGLGLSDHLPLMLYLKKAEAFPSASPGAEKL